MVVVVFQIAYYFLFFNKFITAKHQNKTPNKQPVSIIICAKNEAENLKTNLPFILKQNYPKFEIILINDSSSDETLEVMESFANKNNNIKIVDVKSNETFWGNKKFALTLGIKAATNPILLLTDADCKPKTTSWLKQMSAQITNTKKIVLGYGAYAKINRSLLNKLIRFETLLTAMQYFSFAKAGIPFMGVGRNLAYTKETFFNAKGFQNHMQILSGDDDLFINQVATKTNTAICFSRESFTISKPKTTFKDWITQKRRHVTTANHYQFKHQFLLALFYSTQFLFWSLAILLLSMQFKWQTVLTLFLLRIALFGWFYGKAAKKLSEKDLIPYLPFLELFLIGMQLVIFIANQITKPKLWK